MLVWRMEPRSGGCPRALIGSALRLAPWGLDRVVPASGHDGPFGLGGACEGEQSLQVVGHGDQVPLAADLVKTPQQELPSAKGDLNDAEHRPGSVFAQGLYLLAFFSTQ